MDIADSKHLGRLVSNRNGGRNCVQPSPMSGPVRMKAQRSRITASGSQSVNGSAPIQDENAGGWDEVIADQRAGPGLTAERLPLDQDRVKPLRGSIHGGREPGRAGPHDRGVVRPLAWPDLRPERG
jgi:hypothetical protein